MWPHSGSGAPPFPEDSYVIARHSLLQVCVSICISLFRPSLPFVFHASYLELFPQGPILVSKLILPPMFSGYVVCLLLPSLHFRFNGKAVNGVELSY